MTETPDISTRDGRRLYAEVTGKGTPTVVFEAGMGASRSSWGAVVPTVAGVTRCVTYDRSGLGRSPADTEARTLSRLVDDHIDLLDDIGSGPFVLVGHSWGGPIIRVVAARRPELVAGLVLVDQTDEGCDLFFSSTASLQFAISARVLPVLARTGLLRAGIGRVARQLPEPAASAMREEDTTVAAARSQIAELASSTEDLRALRDNPLAPPDVPVTIISGTKSSGVGKRRRDALIAAHRARAAALPQGRHVDANGSAHLVPLTEPHLVAAEVLRVVEAVRSLPTA